MTVAINLTAIRGTTPIGFFAGLGLLDILGRADPETRLHWSRRLGPRAVLGTSLAAEAIAGAVILDRDRLVAGPLLNWPPAAPLGDVRVEHTTLRQWAEAVLEAEDPVAADMLCGLVAEGAKSGNRKAKPSHLYFLAGQQRILNMARTIGSAIDHEIIEDLIAGHVSRVGPSFAWEGVGRRLFAYRAINPADDKVSKETSIVLNWLAFRGLASVPVATRGTRLITSGCVNNYLAGGFRWPLWEAPLSLVTVRSLVSRSDLVGDAAQWRRERLAPSALSALGVFGVMESRIDRSGEYGAFSPPESVVLDL